MSKAKKQSYDNGGELPDVGRLADGRLIWFVTPGSFRDIRVLQGESWVPLEDATVREILDADGLSKEEVHDLIARGLLKPPA